MTSNRKTNQDNPLNAMTRRQALLSTLFGAGGIGLRAFASGVPAAILMNPRRGLAAVGGACADPSKAQYIILSTSGGGDPVNANVPGMYDDPKINHSTDPRMAATTMTLAGKQVKGAAIWASLPQNILDRTAFFHHATYTVVHGDETKTLQMNGAVKNNEMLVSMLASQLGPCLGCVQTKPMAVGGEMITYQGSPQPTVTPASLASILTLPQGPLANLQKLRDQTLDQLNGWYKAQGNSGQKNFIDRYATSQAQLRDAAGSVLNNLSSIKDNSPASQMSASLAIIQMNLAPVVSVHLPFGGDNHGDNNFSGEAQQHAQSIGVLTNFYQQLATLKLMDKVSFVTLNVFGRTLTKQNGRDHNGMHHVAVMIGSNIKGSQVGGVMPSNGDYSATAIDSTTGASGGDIPFTDTFAAMGKTFGRAAGVDGAYVDQNITGGKPVLGALV